MSDKSETAHMLWFQVKMWRCIFGNLDERDWPRWSVENRWMNFKRHHLVVILTIKFISYPSHRLSGIFCYKYILSFYLLTHIFIPLFHFTINWFNCKRYHLAKYNILNAKKFEHPINIILFCFFGRCKCEGMHSKPVIKILILCDR